MRTLARDRWRRLVQGDSSGRNSRGLPYSWRDSSLERALRSMTGVVRRLDSRETSRRSEQRFSCTASHRKLADSVCIVFVAHHNQMGCSEETRLVLQVASS